MKHHIKVLHILEIVETLKYPFQENLVIYLCKLDFFLISVLCTIYDHMFSNVGWSAAGSNPERFPNFH